MRTSGSITVLMAAIVTAVLPLLLMAQSVAAAESDGQPGAPSKESERATVTAEPLDADARYARQLDAADPNHWLTIGEEALWLSIGAVWYWLDEERNLADWDYPSWAQRFSLEAWRMDNNEFPINFMAHALNGAVFYASPRANDQNTYVATLYSFGTSFVWEFLIEFREKVSVNDMIVTPGAGIPVGEFAHKLWRYVNGMPAKPTTGQQVVAAAGGLPVWVHHQIDGTPPPIEDTYDELGLSTAIRHRFEAAYQLRIHDFGDEALTHGLRLGGRLSTIPYEGRPGDFSLFFHDADIASVQLSGGVGRDAREVELLADTYILGYYDQTIDRRGDGRAMVVGLPVAYRYRFQDFEGWNDRLGLLHLPGAGVDFSLRAGALSFSSFARLHADFAGLHSAAYSAWVNKAVGPDDRPKSILRKHNYYYAWGLSSRLGAELRLGPFDLSAELRFGTYDSQDGLDRTQEELTLDPDASDRWLELEATLGLTIPSTPVRLAIGSQSTDRRSRVEQQSLSRDKQTWSLSGGLVF